MIKIARTAGFCFGVRRSLNIVEQLLKKGLKVCTFGELIHNARVIRRLNLSGVGVCRTFEEIKKDTVLVVRSHGAGPKIYEYVKLHGINIVDACCPFVKKIHRIVKKADFLGKKVLIAGNGVHPEVEGIVEQFIKSRPYVFSSLSELTKILEKNIFLKNGPLVLVSQTTFSVEVFRDCVGLLKKECKNVEIFNTICSATIERQFEAVSLAKEVDFMVVVGGKNSSNTKRLYEICCQFCETKHVESCDELKNLNLECWPKKIGLTAGASTPFCDIKEIYMFLKTKVD